MIVVDASVLLEVLLATEVGVAAQGRLFRKGETLHAPHLIDVEIAQVLRRYGRAGDLTPQRGSEALADLADMPVNRYPHDLLLPRIWDLRQALSAHDAAYVALAEALGAPVLTRDVHLARSRGHKAAIHLV